MTGGYRKFSIAVSAALLAACSQPQTPTQSAQQDDMLRGADGMRDFGDYIVYVNALTTDRLTPDVASTYNVVRSPGRAMLSVSVHRKQEDGSPAAVGGQISATAVNLPGQVRTIPLREIREAEAIYFIGETEVTDQETLTYSIEFLPEGETTALSLRYQTQFFVDR